MEHKFIDVFEKHFPRVCENPGIQPHKEEIRSIVMNVVKDMLGINDRPRASELYHSKTEMPYHKEL